MKKVKIEIKAFTAPDGRPTCVLDVTKNNICQFFRTKKFGTVDVCVFSEETELLRGENRYISPCKSCPIWGKE